MPSVTTWMELEGVILAKINQKEKDKYHKSEIISAICGT